MESLDFDALYEAQSAMVYWTAYSLNHNNDAAKEITQSVFMKAYEQWETVGGLTPPQAKSWLYKTARNLTIDRFRKEKREIISDVFPEFPDADERVNPESALIKSEGKNEMWELVMALPEIYRKPILLYYFAGLSQKEAAQALNISGSTYRSRISRGKAMLERLLLKAGGERYVR